MEVSVPSTSGAAADSPAPAVNGEAATPGTEGTAKKVKKEKKVWTGLHSTGLYSFGPCSFGWVYVVYRVFDYSIVALLQLAAC